MENNSNNNSKLDQVVKKTLANYEVPYNATDWSRMENMLDVSPKSSAFKWTSSLKILIGLVALITSAYILYIAVNSSKTPSKENNPASQPAIEKQKTPEISAPALPITTKPVENKENSSTKKVTTNPNIVTPETTTTINKNELSTAKKTNTIPSSGNTTKTTRKTEEDTQQHILKMGNEPVFGDMLDSSKGIVGKTKEKEQTKKAAQKQGSSIGWNSFIKNVNLDSLKKYQEQQKDSLNKPQ